MSEPLTNPSYSEADEMVRIVARMCGVAIGLLIIIPVFQYVLGVSVREFVPSLAESTLSTAIAR